MRRTVRLIPISLTALALFVGCGGPSKASQSGFRNLGENAPDWVVRGSRVEKGRIYGVGAASGINNIELARSTAGNRGRSEISKILETYSASLMKDYQESVTAGDMSASSESQMVQQAVKTFSANLMTGTEVAEYFAGKDAIYALVVLDFERQKEIASAKAKMGPGLKDYVDQNGDKILGDMEDDFPGRPPSSAPPPPPPPPVAGGGGGAVDPGPDAVVGGPKPGWTDGQCDQNRYLCGVGSGPDRGSADIDARAELARIFESNIKSVATSFQSAASKINSATGENWEETQKVTSFSMVSTDRVVSMSQILHRWDDGKGMKWTLAVIDRAQASAALRDQIEQKDSMIEAHVSRAEGTDDKLARFKALRKAVAALAEREALNSDLRVIDRSGRGIPPPHDIGEIVNMLEGASESLRIGIALSGAGADRVQSCLEEGLTNKGYQIEANSVEDEDEDADIDGSFDVLIKGKVKSEKKGKVAGSQVVKVRLSLKLINGKTNKTVKTINASRQSSRGSVKNAASTAAHQLCKKKMGAVVKAIDQYFKR